MQSKNRCKPEGAALIAIAIVLFTSIGVMAAEEPDWCRHLPRAGYAKLEKIPVKSDWFEVHRIQPGLYSISEPRQFEEVISYLIVGSKRALLWDTGMGISKIGPLVKSLTSVPVIVLNSHTHPDHIGGNFEFHDVWGVQTEFTRKNSKGYSDPEMKDWVGRENICGDLPSSFNPSTYAIKPFRISHFVKDGDVIDLGERQLEIIQTPGHTPDSLCLLDRKNRLLFTGDTFYPGPLYLYSPETNFKHFIQSVNRLARLRKDVDLLLTAHNDPVSTVTSLIALQEAVEQIRSGKMKPMDQDGLQQYFFQGFSILLKKQ